jgi:hypothetical protein
MAKACLLRKEACGAFWIKINGQIAHVSVFDQVFGVELA